MSCIRSWPTTKPSATICASANKRAGARSTCLCQLLDSGALRVMTSPRRDVRDITYMKRAFVFPGQGSQAPGMGQALANAFAPARDLFDEIDDALSQHLSRLMFDGPESELMLTENAQPALLAASLAVVRVLESDGGFDIRRHAAYV